jgi:ATP-dependent Clp protease adaptor protein ClpS
MPGSETRRERGIATRERIQTQTPRRYRVLLHNDDYTTMEFVIAILMTHFAKTRAQALTVMLQVHHKGVGVAGVFSRDEAETKADAVMKQARAEGMPLLLSTEPE